MRKRMHRIRAGAVLAILVLAMAPASRAGTPSCPAGFEEFTSPSTGCSSDVAGEMWKS